MHTHRLKNIKPTATRVCLYQAFTKKYYCLFNNLNKTRQIIILLLKRYYIFTAA